MALSRLPCLVATTILTAVMVLGMLVLPNPSHAAAAGGCATHAEIEKRLRDGKALWRVRRVVGSKGQVVERSATDLFLEFRPCNPKTHSNAYVQFDRARRGLRFRAWDFGFYWVQK